MWLSLEISASPKEISLHLFQSSTDQLWYPKQGEEINRETRQSALNQHNSLAHRDVLSLPRSQPFSESFFNRVSSPYRLVRSPKWKTQVCGGETRQSALNQRHSVSTLLTLPTGVISLLLKLILSLEKASNHIKV